MSETDFMRRFWKLAMAVPGLRLFRNNSGMGWVGNVRRAKDGSISISNHRPLHAGLCTGSADLIGYAPMQIKEEHVGKQVAVFVAVETKASNGGLDEDQENFLRSIHSAGGVALVASEDGDVGKVLRWQPGGELDVDIAKFSRKTGRRRASPRS